MWQGLAVPQLLVAQLPAPAEAEEERPSQDSFVLLVLLYVFTCYLVVWLYCFTVVCLFTSLSGLMSRTIAAAPLCGSWQEDVGILKASDSLHLLQAFRQIQFSAEKFTRFGGWPCLIQPDSQPAGRPTGWPDGRPGLSDPSSRSPSPTSPHCEAASS